jgi:murein DD-endopeptidase MepM/ murein hydrolase activator NlpD
MKKMLIGLLMMFILCSVSVADTFPLDKRDCRIEKGEIDYIVLTGWYNQWRDNECYTGYHRAYDIPAERNSKVRAVKAGQVVEIGYDYPRIKNRVWVNGYGNYIDIRDDEGCIWRYGHLENTAQIDEGSFVSEGQYIGRVGATGLCYLNGSPRFAYHLHLEKRDRNGVKVKFGQDFTNIDRDSKGLAFATR